jgi:hypothetical protein
LAIGSKKRGKSGGARILTYVHIKETTVLVFSIYDKGKINNVPDQEIKDLLVFKFEAY